MNSVRWIVDANLWIASTRVNRGQKLINAARFDTYIPEVVYEECRRHMGGWPEVVKELAHLKRVPSLGGPEARNFQLLLRARFGDNLKQESTTDRGELWCMAYLMEDLDARFVTHDRPARQFAMDYVGERVVSGHVWLRTLVDQHRLAKEDAVAIGRQGNSFPLFWEAWSKIP